MSTDRLHLIHCEEHLKRIEKYTKDGRGAFMASPLHQDAVFWNLEMIAACAKRVTDHERRMHPHVDWDRLCSLCKGLVGAELRADLERTWQIVEESVPILKHQLRLVLTAKT